MRALSVGYLLNTTNPMAMTEIAIATTLRVCVDIVLTSSI